MNPFQTILFIVFVLPAVMVKNGWKMLTKNMTPEQKKRMLWRIPEVLLALLVILTIILVLNGFRW